ncbi:MAG: hypothetical protein IJL03_03725 [Lachnospiraceae bacterium]|nr:hypothetical protein [Lachnospiraceae bacterium]
MKRIVSMFMLITLITGGMTVRKTSAKENDDGGLVIDLSKGAAIIGFEYERYGDEVAFVCESLGYAVEWDGVDSKMDVDGDGTLDIACTYWNPYFYPESPYYVFTPLPGWSLTGDVTITSSMDKIRAAYKQADYDLPSEKEHITKVVVKTGNLKEIQNEYKITAEQGKVCRYVRDNDGKARLEEVTGAVPGEILYFSIDLPKGQFLKNLKSGFFDFGKQFSDLPIFWEYVMPASDITLTPVIEKQKAATFKYSAYCDIYSEGRLGDVGNCVMESMFNETWCSPADYYEGFYDIDGDGTDDVYIGTAYAGTAARPCRLRSVNTYVTEGQNDGPFWPITVDFGDDRYVIDEWPDLYTSAKNAELLKKNLEPYRMPDNEEWYDLDGNGSADFSIESGYLSTCSLGYDTVIVPAVTGGINHDITFFDSKTQKTVYSINLIGENADKAMIGFLTETKKPGGGFMPEQKYQIIPAEGYEVYSAFSKETDVSREYNAPYYSFTLPYYDVTIQVEIKEIGSVTPTPTPTPTPTDVPTATPKPTEEPAVLSGTPGADEDRTDAGEKDAKTIAQKDEPLSPLFWIIPLCVVLVTAAVLAVCALKRKSAGVPADTTGDAGKDNASDDFGSQPAEPSEAKDETTDGQ